MLLKLEGCEHVLGDRLGRHTARGEERLHPESRRCAAAEGSAPGILASELRTEEESLFVGPVPPAQQVPLDRVGIEEMLRRLDDADIRIVEEAEHPLEDIAMGHEIR